MIAKILIVFVLTFITHAACTDHETPAVPAPKRARTTKKKLVISESAIDNDFDAMNSPRGRITSKNIPSAAALLAHRVQAIIPTTNTDELMRILERTNKQDILSEAVHNYEMALVKVKKFVQENSEPPFPLIGLTAKIGTKTYDRQLLSCKRSAAEYYMSDKKFNVLSAVHILTNRSSYTR